MTEKKYIITDEKHPVYHSARRIKAVKNFGIIEEGELGGYIQDEKNLSHSNLAWVGDNAVILDNASVFDNAYVFGKSVITHNAKVYGDANVGGNSSMYGVSRVSGNSTVTNSRIEGVAKVYGDATVHNCELKDSSKVYDDAIVRSAKICMNAEIFGDAKVEGGSHSSSVVICDNAKIYDHARVEGGSTIIGGSVRVSSFCEIGGSTTVGGDIELTSEFDIFTFQNPYSGNIFTWVEPSDKIYKKNFKDFLSNKVDSSITIDQLREGEKEGSTYPNKAVKVFDLYVKMIKDIKKIKNE